jgi:hypothetical protein
VGRYRIDFAERSLADPTHSHVVSIGIVNPRAPGHPHDPTKPWMSMLRAEIALGMLRAGDTLFTHDEIEVRPQTCPTCGKAILGSL